MKITIKTNCMRKLDLSKGRIKSPKGGQPIII